MFRETMMARPPGLVVYLYVSLVYIVCLTQGARRMNVLFLVADDMRPELNAYLGADFPSLVHPKIHSPSLDALASRSLVLKRAYCQQAVCSPSRTSLLTGRRPDTTHVYNLQDYWRKVGGNFTTIPQYFKQQGYHTVGMGKVFHPGSASHHDDPISWSEPYWHSPSRMNYWKLNRVRHQHSWLVANHSLQQAHPLPDTEIATHAVDVLKRVAPGALSGKVPFFVAVGFHKPHLPFVVPEEYFRLYPRNDIKLPDNPYAPTDMPSIAWSDYGELRNYFDVKDVHASGAINTTLPDRMVKDLRRAYYSAISFVDAMIGKVITELEKLGLANNTIISFWGDHGWQLGEHGEWTKHTNFEDSTHAPMMVHIPGKTDGGITTEKLTEFVDLFPTLVDAVGLPSLDLCPEDSSDIEVCREGVSLLPLIANPKDVEWKTKVFSQYPRHQSHMGYSMRTDRYRYTEWVHFKHYPDYRPVWMKLNATELYDHHTDPEENHNLACEETMQVTVKKLKRELHAGWRAAL